MKAILAAAVALLLAIPAAASAATVPVTSLSGDFAVSGGSYDAGYTTFTPNSAFAPVLNDYGVQFGPYADGWHQGGSLIYAGFSGTLKEISDLTFTARYNTDENTTVGVPYLRVFLAGDHDAIFSPNTQAGTSQAGKTEEDVDHTWNVMEGVVRYDDDAGFGGPGTYGVNGAPWSTLITDHGGEQVTGIEVSAGISAGTNLSVLQSRLRVNADEFVFNSPRPAGQTGPTVAGTATTTTTTIVVQQAASVRLIGAQLRIIHVQRRKGEKFLSARAILRGKSLKVRGRAIQVDLRNKLAGNYNVHIVAKYRTKSGKVHIVRSTRNLSVTVA